MSSEWSSKSTKKGRKKKVAKLHGKPVDAAKQKKSPKSRKYRGDENDDNNYNSPQSQRGKQAPQPRLTGQQYQISKQISSLLPNVKLNQGQYLKIITKLDLTWFNPKNERMKIDILNEIVSELQDSMSGKSRKLKKSKNGESLSNVNNTQKNQNKNKSSKQSKKSGKFTKNKFINNVGHVLFEFVDGDTLSNILRMEEFSFIAPNKEALSMLTRLRVYTSFNDISYRLRSFNSKLSTVSTLKLYELRRCALNVSTTKLINMITLNALGLSASFKATKVVNPKITMDVTANKEMMNDELIQKLIGSKCKQFNIWRATDINDLNEAYLNEFAEFQQAQNIQTMQRGLSGRDYLANLDEFILSPEILGNAKKSLHFGYVKVINNLHLDSYLFLFIQLKQKLKSRRDKDLKQFMVWYGQCGVEKINKY